MDSTKLVEETSRGKLAQHLQNLQVHPFHYVCHEGKSIQTRRVAVERVAIHAEARSTGNAARRSSDRSTGKEAHPCRERRCSGSCSGLAIGRHSKDPTVLLTSCHTTVLKLGLMERRGGSWAPQGCPLKSSMLHPFGQKSSPTILVHKSSARRQ